MKAKHPMQPFIKDENGTVRFKANAIVEWLIDEANEGRAHDMNDIAEEDFSDEDRRQFAQLIGYSLCGYHELNYVSDEAAREATKEAKKVSPDAMGCRDTGCPIHCAPCPWLHPTRPERKCVLIADHSGAHQWEDK